MKENYIESSLDDIGITREVVEKKILSKFPYLNDKKQLQIFFSSYDFRQDEENMIKVWDEILKYLFLGIFSTFGMKISEIKAYTIIGNHIPTGLMNIIQELRIRQKLITDFDITNQEFYKKNFPELYSDNDSSGQGWGSYLFSGVKKLVNFGGDKLGCRETKEEAEEIKLERRKDISEEDKNKVLPDFTIIFNYELLRNNSNQLLAFLSDVLQENDNDIISKNDFIKEVNLASSNENGGFYKGIDLHFGTIYIDYCIIYLNKIKKIALFTIEENNRKIEFIKLMINKSDVPKEKDKVIAKLLLKCDILQIKIKEQEKKIESCLNNAKMYIRKGDKKGAKPWIIRKKNYEKFKQNYDNTYITLIQQIIDIKTIEDNAKVTEILKNCNNIFKNVGVDRDDFLDACEDLKEQKDFQNEINTGLKDLAGDDDMELDDELVKLEKENANESMKMNMNVNVNMNTNNNKNEENLEFPNAINMPINPFSEESQALYKEK
jgi:hypothetical protein